MKKVFAIGLLVFIMNLSACVTRWYEYRGQKYSSPGEALSAQRVDIQEAVTAIPISERKLPFRLAVSLPSALTLRSQAVCTIGTGIGEEDLLDYAISTLLASNSGFVEALRRSACFEAVETMPEDVPIAEAQAAGNDYLLRIFYRKGAGEQWELTDLRSQESRLITPHHIKTIDGTRDRYMALVEHVRSSVERMTEQPPSP